jgi:hypothetical protein
MKDIYCNNEIYKIIKEIGIGYRKKAYLAKNKKTNEYVIVFEPEITLNYNNMNENILKFKKDIDILENIFKKFKDKCNIKPLYLSKDDMIIITKYFDGKIFYRYLCEV